LKKRNIHIDTLRGIACLLLVSYHVIGGTCDQGLRIDHGPYRDASDILVYIRMPLFTFISGIVYAYRPFSGDTKKFITGKLRRLIVPMLVIGTAFALMQANIQGTHDSVQNWYLLHILPVAHFWFIESLFLVFLVMIPLESFRVLQSIKGFILAFLAATLLYLSNIDTNYFSITGAIYLFPYFLSGLALERFSILEKLDQKVGYVLIGLVTAVLTLVAFDMIEITSKRAFLALIIGIVSCMALLIIKLKSSFLARIGYYSYAIYLYHIFFTAGSRILLNKLGVYDVTAVLFLSIVLGIGGPILLEKLFDGTNLTRILFLGKSKTDPSRLWLVKRFALAH
jgi:peptidoglycan/LPS O-acetylase OafA/YrhL